jgi:chromosome segregation ATPase
MNILLEKNSEIQKLHAYYNGEMSKKDKDHEDTQKALVLSLEGTFNQKEKKLLDQFSTKEAKLNQDKAEVCLTNLTLEEDIEKIKKEVAISKKEISSYKKKMLAYDTKLKNMHISDGKYESEINELKIKLKEYCDSKNLNDKKVSDLENSLQIQVDISERFEIEIEKSKKKIKSLSSESDKISRELLATNKKNELYVNDNKSKDNKISEMKKQLDNKNIEISQLRKSLKESQNKLIENSDIHSKTQDECSKYLRERDGQIRNMEQLNNTIYEMHQFIDILQKEIVILRSQNYYFKLEKSQMFV